MLLVHGPKSLHSQVQSWFPLGCMATFVNGSKIMFLDDFQQHSCKNKQTIFKNLVLLAVCEKICAEKKLLRNQHSLRPVEKTSCMEIIRVSFFYGHILKTL